MPRPTILAQLPKHTREAVRFYWQTRSSQSQKQRAAGGTDQGLRSAVTGGAQMDGFMALLTKLAIEAGIDRSDIYHSHALELPGYFRPNKKWDFLIVVKGQLVAALKTKAQRGSFSDHNRAAQEIMCDALDLWAAYRKAPGACPRPWVGFLMLAEAPASLGKTYGDESPTAQRCKAFCRRLILERFYDSSALVISSPKEGGGEICSESEDGLGFGALATSFLMSAAVFSGKIAQFATRHPVAC